MDELIRKAKAGDVEAFEAVVRQTARPLRAMLAWYVSDPGAVDDLLQETYLYVFEHLGDYEPGTNFLAYLKAVARTTSLKRYRKWQREQQAFSRFRQHARRKLAELAEPALDDDPRADQLRRLRACMQGLGERAQRLIHWRYFDRMGVNEIAEQLGKSANAVAVTLHRIRGSLGDCLRRETTSTAGGTADE